MPSPQDKTTRKGGTQKMPIQRTTQKWEIGQTVKVGFMALQILELIPTPGDYAPDKYRMKDPRTDKQYLFTPHNGIEKIERREE
jgi:hypothetical protein